MTEMEDRGKADIARYQEQIQQAEEMLRKWETQRETLTQEVEQLQKKLADARAEHEQIGEQEKTIRELQLKASQLEASFQEKEEKVHDLQVRQKQIEEIIAKREQETKKTFLEKWRSVGKVLLFACCLTHQSVAWAATNMVIMLDRSGSMGTTDSEGLALPTAAYILDELKFRDPAGSAAVVLFDSDLDVRPADRKLTANIPALIKDLKGIPAPEGETEMAGALKVGFKILADGGKGGEAVLLTDGAPTSLNPENFTGRERSAVERYLQTLNQKKADRRTVEADLGKVLQEFIVKEVVPGYRQTGIRLMPIGFGKADEDFLRQLGGTVGCGKVSNVAELIPAVDELIPKGPRTFTMRTKINAEQTTFEIPENVDKVRIAILYPESGKAPDNVKPLLRNGGKDYTASTADYLDVTRSKGSKAFERFIIDKPSAGQWLLRLDRKDKSLPLPAAELLVEMKTNLNLRTSIEPSTVCIGNEAKIGVVLESPSSPGKGLTLTNISAEILDEKGKLLQKLSHSDFQADAAQSYWHTLRIPASYGAGVKELHLAAYMNNQFLVRASARLTVQPAEACKCPLRLQPEISYGGEKGSLKRDAIAFKPIGASKDQSAAIGGIALRIPAGSIPQHCPREFPIELRLEPLVSEKGTILSGSAGWIEILPNKGKVAEAAPFQFEITATLPAEISSDLEDGNYKGSIVVVSENLEENVTIPIEIPIKVPVIEILSATVSKPPRQILETALCCSPPTEQSVAIKLRTTSPLPVNITATAGAAFYFKNDKEKREDVVAPEDLQLAPEFDPAGAVEVPPDATRTLDYKIVVNAGERLPAGLYYNQIVLKGDAVRAKTLDLQLSIPKTYRMLWIITLAGAILALLLLVFAVARVRTLQRGIAGTGVRYRGSSLFSSYDGSPSFNCSAFTITHDQGFGDWRITAHQPLTHRSPLDGDRDLSMGEAATLQNGDQILLGRAMILNVDITPGDPRDELLLSVAVTPFRRGHWVLHGALAVLAAAILVSSALFPNTLCNALYRFWPW